MNEGEKEKRRKGEKESAFFLPSQLSTLNSQLSTLPQQSGGWQESWLQQFEYDPYGNRMSLASRTKGGLLVTKRLAVSQASNRLLDPGYKYDAAGNLVAAPGGWTYSYDAENRMLTATLDKVTTYYQYDGEGRRVRKSIVDGNTGKVTTTRFVYGPSGLLAIVEFD